MQYCYFCSDLVLYFALSHTLTEVSQTDKKENKENTHALHLVDHTKAHTHLYIPILVAHNQSTVPTVLPYILPWCNPVQRSPVVFLALNLIISTTLSNYHCYQEPCNTHTHHVYWSLKRLSCETYHSFHVMSEPQASGRPKQPCSPLSSSHPFNIFVSLCYRMHKSSFFLAAVRWA